MNKCTSASSYVLQFYCSVSFLMKKDFIFSICLKAQRGYYIVSNQSLIRLTVELFIENLLVTNLPGIFSDQDYNFLTFKK